MRVAVSEGFISDEDVQKVRDANDVVAVIGERAPVKQRGRDFWCCCPLHNEKTPSLKIDPALQLWHCFGCGEGGDVFGFIMKADDLTFPEAVRKLADRAHVEITQTVGRGSISTSRKARLTEVCRETADFYHMQLMRGSSSQAAHARSYLAGRGLGGRVPKKWRLGFAPGSGSLVRHLQARGFAPQELIDANVALASDGRKLRDRFYNRVMFPICDAQGDPIAFGGRIIGDGQPKYLNSNETPLFRKSRTLYGLDKAKNSLVATGTAIVVEGYTDVIALSEAGVENVVATLGTALTLQHIRLLSRYAKHRIVYLFDGDAAGQKAADRALEFIDRSMTPEVGKKQIELCAVTLPNDLDPADFVAKRGAEELRDLIDDAKPLLQYGIERRIASHDTSTPEGRAAAFADAISVLAPIKDSLLASEYAVRIGALTRTREEDALAALRSLASPRRDGASDDSASRTSAPSADAAGAYGQRLTGLSRNEINRRRFERQLLRVCAQKPSIALVHADALAGANWHVQSHARIAASLLATLIEDPEASPATIVNDAEKADPSASSILTGTFNESGSTPESFAEFLVEELAIGDLEDAIADLRAQLSLSEFSSDQDRDALFESITGMQKDLAAKKSRHMLLS